MDRNKITTKRYALAQQAAADFKKLQRLPADEKLRNLQPRNAAKRIRDINRDVFRVIVDARERIMGADNSKTIAPTTEAKLAGISVARLFEAGKTREPRGFGTGFLVAPNVLITNNHVFENAGSAMGCVANFGYETSADGISLENGQQYQLRPDIFFYTDPGLDFSLVCVDEDDTTNTASLSANKFLPLIATKGKVTKGSRINIIQYPKGGLKKYTTEENFVLEIDDDKGVIFYSTDTEQGSSGSPDFNEFWEVAGLHFTSVPETNENGDWITVDGEIFDKENMDDSAVHWIANAGKSISKIVAHLQSLKLAPAHQVYIDRVLKNSGDPLLSLEANKPVVITEPKNTPVMDHITMNFYGTSNIYIGAAVPGIAPIASTVNTDAKPIAGAEEKKERFDEDYTDRKGYDPGFLGKFKVPMPTVEASRIPELYKVLGAKRPYIIPYHHFSLVLNKKRRMAMWTASNVVYDETLKDNRTREMLGNGAWRLDPRIPAKYQIQAAEFYDPATLIDKGHLVRRDDNCWAYLLSNNKTDSLGIEYANADTFHWTNCTPQHEAFNRDTPPYKGVGKWGVLENAIKAQLEKTEAQDPNKDYGQRACVLAGPVLAADDPEYLDIQYPLKFWKVFAINSKSAGNLVYGFILSQEDKIDELGIEKEGVPRFNKMVKAMQASLADITAISGVIFDKSLHAVDVMKDKGVHNLDDVKPELVGG